MEGNFEADGNIKIKVLVPGALTRTIILSKQNKIEKLSKCLQNNWEHTFVYKGNIIDSNLSFNDIGIFNGDIIIIFQKNFNQFDNSDLMLMKMSKESFFRHKLDMTTNNNVKKESYRLKDMRDLKIEGSRRLYKKMIHKIYLKNRKENDLSLANDLDINYKPLPMPSTEAMPIIW